ncbi:CPBP family intramembrane glutamic endopeptidase [Nigerium massiliense]|uniref:CPBP family intramembrane glutamic endopeptidase n=1 Tax=Nigerium massiliense TaxID=1522317 RepID=UPI000693E38A|nr:CPBP family intramembrane glutamic endopeptidase [Nigerium massiliense]
MASALETFATEQVPDGAEYTGVLRTPQASPVMSVIGVALGVVTYVLAAGVVTPALAWLYWRATGAPGTFEETYRQLTTYQVPFGMSAVQLGIATLIPISLALVLFVHRVRPGYLLSVRPGMRWGLLGRMLAVALVVFAVVLVVQTSLSTQGFHPSPQPGLAWFMLACLLTSPLQAAAEELFFRGYLMQSLGALVPNHWFGIGASALIFALFHGVQNPWLFLDRFAFGVLAGYLAVRTGGLEAGIAAHVVNNILAFLLAGLTIGIAQVKGLQSIGPLDAAGDLVLFGLFTLAALLLARRLRVQTRTVRPGTPARTRR